MLLHEEMIVAPRHLIRGFYIAFEIEIEIEIEFEKEKENDF
jgi:hypothetical protein